MLYLRGPFSYLTSKELVIIVVWKLYDGMNENFAFIV